jgi:GTP:adenosylcobinamide-phosphate guanylyltransferase
VVGLTVDAIVLAGALNKPPLELVSGERLEALISVAGRPMVQWVIDAIRASKSVDRIIVVGPSDELKQRVSGDNVVFVDPGDSILENVKRGAKHVRPSRRALVVTSDIPLLTGEAIDDFVARCQDDFVQVFYSIVRREAIERAFSGISRTYVTVKDGIFTGGNLLLLDSDIFDRFGQVIHRAISLRKRPIEMCRLLGLRCMVKYLFRSLSIADIERRVEHILSLRGRGIVSDFPEVGIDVDKPEDYHRIQEILSGRA